MRKAAALPRPGTGADAFPAVVRVGHEQGSEVEGRQLPSTESTRVPLPSDPCRAGTRMECFESSQVAV